MTLPRPLLLPLLICAAAAAAAAVGLGGIDPEHFKVAAVRQPPPGFPLPVAVNVSWVDFSLNATVAQALDIIREAKADGVNLIAFPELYFPGYPVAVNTRYTGANVAQYASQSLAVNGSEFQKLRSAFRDAGLYGSFGFSELGDDAIYMGQALIGPDGDIIRLRRKVRPSGVERDIWSDGDREGLRVDSTPYGRIGQLGCWEHMHPAMTFPMMAQAENMHVAALPYSPDLGADVRSWEATELGFAYARYYAVNAQTTTIVPSIGATAIFDSTGRLLNQSDASGSPSTHFITAELNTTLFDKDEHVHVTTGEQSWAALREMDAAFPAYIPHVADAFFEKRRHSIKHLAASGT